jgi:hypothetical protein
MRRGVVLTFVFGAALGHASLAPRMTLDQMADASECVVEATVLRSWPAWDPSQFIWTHYELAVHEWFKATGAPTILVSEPGGTVDGVTMQVAGTTLYNPGEHVLLFLRRTPIGYLRAAGNGQGKFTITPGNRVWAANEVTGYLQATASHLDGMPLEQFKLRVRRAVDRAAAGRAAP